MKSTTFSAMLDESLDEALLSVLGPLDRIEPANGAVEVVAVIGFAGHQIAGSLGISAPSDWFAATHPLRTVTTVDEPSRLDWAGELANQLLGLVKRRLGSHGFVTWATTPVVLRGLGLTRHHRPAEAARVHRRRIPPGDQTITVWIEVHRPQDLDFPVSTSVTADPAQPGEIMLF